MSAHDIMMTLKIRLRLCFDVLTGGWVRRQRIALLVLREGGSVLLLERFLNVGRVDLERQAGWVVTGEIRQVPRRPG